MSRLRLAICLSVICWIFDCCCPTNCSTVRTGPVCFCSLGGSLGFVSSVWVPPWTSSSFFLNFRISRCRPQARYHAEENDAERGTASGASMILHVHFPCLADLGPVRVARPPVLPVPLPVPVLRHPQALPFLSSTGRRPFGSRTSVHALVEKLVAVVAEFITPILPHERPELVFVVDADVADVLHERPWRRSATLT
jgi:hypothetical protein